MNIFSKLLNSLKKTKNNFSNLISKIFTKELNDEFFEELEYVLIASDLGVHATNDVIELVKKEAKSNRIKTQADFEEVLKETLLSLITFDDKQEELETPALITFVGVNGVGKTTAIGKLANHYKNNGNKVLMVAADTFRAAASDQLTEWSKRAGARIVKYQEGADPGAVVFDGIASAIAKREDIVLVDTAGRLHTKNNLMDELKKINKIINKEWENRTHKNYLVIDATTGQNALTQVKMFNDAVGIDGIVLTKLDGTAKGGIVFAIGKEFNIPVVYVGVGEGIDDIAPFDAKTFVDGIL